MVGFYDLACQVGFGDGLDWWTASSTIRYHKILMRFFLASGGECNSFGLVSYLVSKVKQLSWCKETGIEERRNRDESWYLVPPGSTDKRVLGCDSAEERETNHGNVAISYNLEIQKQYHTRLRDLN